jgi:hypothetical protein
VAVFGRLQQDLGGTTKRNDSALAVGAAGEAFTIIAREESVAFDVPGATFRNFFDPVINDAGRISFIAGLKGSSIENHNSVGVWWGTPHALGLLARSSSASPDAAGQTVPDRVWRTFVSLAIPDGAEAGPVLLARVQGTGIQSKNNLGLWAVDSGGQLRELLRTGDIVSVGDRQKSLAKMTLLNSSVGIFSTQRSYNATGSLALLATFTDKSQALLRIDIP